jgi:S-DNA-T family DNA segregation ATPase FtsK/SpoIIIE
VNATNNTHEKIRENSIGYIFIGLLLLCLSALFTISLISYTSSDVALFSFSLTQNLNWLDDIGAFSADFLLQSFGLFAYPLIFLIFIWSLCFMTGKIQRIKHRYCVFLAFTLMGCIVFNVASSNSFFANIMRDNIKADYYAGGFVGYSLSKIIFVNILGQYVWNKWIFTGIFIVWLFITKEAFFINFGSIFEKVSLLFGNITQNIAQRKRNKLDNGDAVWTSQVRTYDPGHEDGKYTTPSDELQATDNDHMAKYVDISGIVVGGGEYTIPHIDLLDKYNQNEHRQDDKKIASLSSELKNVLEEFGVKGEILNVRQGPVVTMFEFRPSPGIKTSRVISLSDDIARSMSAVSARISTLPGQNAIGIELPNKHRQTVYLREIISSDIFRDFTGGIPLILGKDISGNPILADLAKMPHLLVAGTTGSGKSVSINDMILSILFKFSPKDCKLIMIDPKMLELSVYDEIPHLLTPVVTDHKKAVFALKWAVTEMESRYRMMSKLGVRNIDGFNKKLVESREKGDMLVRKVQTGFDQETGRPIFETQQLDFEPMPYIVVIVDEMADLMLVAGKDVEAAIQRLAQMARAAGIHLIMATQRPSVDVITGTIKANFPTRISFQVTSKIDSRTILGEQGAEQLLGQGDMLYMSGAGRILRIHGPFVKDNEVERIVSYIKGQCEPEYVDVISEPFQDDSKMGSDKGNAGDELYQKALEIVMADRKVSISYIQRKLQIGYNRAARIIEEMEGKGIVSVQDHTGKRKILV